MLSAAFLLGGSSRADVASSLALRPLSAAALAYGLSGLKWDDVRDNKFILGLASAIVCIPCLQLIPLPPWFWRGLAGRELIEAIDGATGNPGPWRPLTMTPVETRNAALSLLTPAAILILGIQLDVRDRFRLVPVVLALSVASILLGILQLSGGADSPFYLYRQTNPGSFVGLFANSNHHALFLACLFPVLVVAVGAHRASPVASAGAVLAGVVLVPVVLVTGSRAGLAVAILAIASATLLALTISSRKATPVRLPSSKWLAVGATLGVLGSTGMALSYGRAVAIDRWLRTSVLEELRLRVLPTAWGMTKEYLPFGSGLGSFAKVYQVAQPETLLMPEYMNHLHNDWLELALTGGLPASALLFVALGAFGKCAWVTALRYSSDRQEQGFDLVVLGLSLMVLIGVASTVDYPLRTPALAALFTVSVVWGTCRLQLAPPEGTAWSARQNVEGSDEREWSVKGEG
jgi:hypothetical protein